MMSITLSIFVATCVIVSGILAIMSLRDIDRKLAESKRWLKEWREQEVERSIIRADDIEIHEYRYEILSDEEWIRVDIRGKVKAKKCAALMEWIEKEANDV
jgi:hypothetical protein